MEIHVRTYVVLLRGLMPSGKNSLKMAELKEVLEKDIFSNVRTYIQSGNVLLETDLPKRELEEKVHRLIKKNIGPNLVIIAKTRRQLKFILSSNPIQKEDMSRVFYTIFSTPPEKKKITALQSEFSSEDLVILDNAAYMFVPKGGLESKLNNNYLEKKLGISATTRNLNTMTKLIELSKEEPPA